MRFLTTLSRFVRSAVISCTGASRTIVPGRVHRPGTYEYVCIVHAGLGMRGMITVIE